MWKRDIHVNTQGTENEGLEMKKFKKSRTFLLTTAKH